MLDEFWQHVKETTSLKELEHSALSHLRDNPRLAGVPERGRYNVSPHMLVFDYFTSVPPFLDPHSIH